MSSLDSSSSSPNLLSNSQMQLGTDAPEENSGYGMRSTPRHYQAAGRSCSDANTRGVMAGVEADMGLNESSTCRHLYTSKTLTNSAFAVLEELRRDKQLCDVVIRVGANDCSAHRVVLAATCPYFRGMFTG